MSIAFSAMLMLLGSSVVIAFVLQPSNENPAASSTHNSCQFDSLDIKKRLLRDLNLQAEPRLPAGGLDVLRERWQRNFGSLSDRTTDLSVATSGYGSRRSLECCSVTSEIFMKDLGWDNWVVYPPSLTLVQCALCNYDTNTVQCPSPHANSQVPRCLPRSKEMVPVVYVDETGTVVISSVYLSRSCESANIQQPGTE